MVKVIVALLIAIPFGANAAEINQSKPVEFASACYKKADYRNGNEKICVYNCGGQDKILSIASYEQCPYNVND